MIPRRIVYILLGVGLVVLVKAAVSDLLSPVLVRPGGVLIALAVVATAVFAVLVWRPRRAR